MTKKNAYIPPKIWVWQKTEAGKWSTTNRPIAEATHDTALPVGDHPLQLYSLATPNGQKVTIMLEELLEAGEKGADYDAWLIKIAEGMQFSTGFLALNPNGKIPALFDKTQNLRIFESGAILLYLAEKFSHFIPQDPKGRSECLNWLFWLHGSAPFLGGGFGHFFAYAPEKFEYPINRFSMEAKRQLDVLDRHLAQSRFLAGTAYSIADIATWPWYGNLVLGGLYDAGTFLQVRSYKNVSRWAREISKRPAVKRGRRVNRITGDTASQLPERHDAADFDPKP